MFNYAWFYFVVRLRQYFIFISSDSLSSYQPCISQWDYIVVRATYQNNN